MLNCEECGKTDVPVMVIVFSLKNKEESETLYTQSVYLCEECLNLIKQDDETSATIH
jgi:hypothetical protein